jgi:hypothetical protein
MIGAVAETPTRPAADKRARAAVGFLMALPGQPAAARAGRRGGPMRLAGDRRGRHAGDGWLLVPLVFYLTLAVILIGSGLIWLS